MLLILDERSFEDLDIAFNTLDADVYPDRQSLFSIEAYTLMKVFTTATTTK